MTALPVARRTVLAGMVAASLPAAASPAGFNRGPTVAEMFRRTRELDAEIGDLLLAGRDDEQDPYQEKWLELVDRIARTAARDLTGVRCKVRLAAEALDTGDVHRAEALLDSVEADLDVLDRAGAG